MLTVDDEGNIPNPYLLISLIPDLMQRGGVSQSSGEGERVRPAHRTWLLMPFMHSEELADQQVMSIGVGVCHVYRSVRKERLSA